MNINMKTLEQHVCYQGSAAPVIIRRRKAADSRWSLDAVHIDEHGLRVTECVTGIDYCPFCGAKLPVKTLAEDLEADRYSEEYKAQRKELGI